jgi:hypothetical protein
MSAKSRRSEIIGQGTFFFERKNQKTFDSWPMRRGRRARQFVKGLLLLFFTKRPFFNALRLPALRKLNLT